MRIVFMGGLRKEFGTPIEITLEKPIKLRDLAKILSEKVPKITDLIDQTRGVKPGYLLFINGTDYSLMGGLDAVIDNDDVIHVVPVNHGG